MGMKFIRWMTPYHMDGNDNCDDDYGEIFHMYDLTIWMKIPNLIKLILMKMTTWNEMAPTIDIKVTQMKFMFQMN
jgi:hypothetical protein